MADLDHVLISMNVAQLSSQYLVRIATHHSTYEIGAQPQCLKRTLDTVALKAAKLVEITCCTRQQLNDAVSKIHYFTHPTCPHN